MRTIDRAISPVPEGPVDVSEGSPPHEPGPSPDLLGDLQLAAIHLPVALRGDDAPTVLRHLSRAARMAHADLDAARTDAARAMAASSADSAAYVLAALAVAGLAGMDADWPTLRQSGERAFDATMALPGGARIPFLTALLNTALRYGDLDVAQAVATALLTFHRETAARLGTPEALRDLSMSLDDVAAAAAARGDWAAAETAYTESLTLARDLADRLGTPEAPRDLSISLNRVGAAAARGDAATTESAYTESLTLARDLVDNFCVPEYETWLTYLLNHRPEGTPGG